VLCDKEIPPGSCLTYLFSEIVRVPAKSDTSYCEGASGVGVGASSSDETESFLRFKILNCLIAVDKGDWKI
jgi:hypothetical protein